MENRTIKHEEWLKIVDSRATKKTNRKQSKAVAGKRPSTHIWFTLFFITLTCIFGYRMMDKETQVSVNSLSANAKQLIERHFSKQFMMGSWQLSRVKFGDSEIGVYVQIPNELALSAEDQKRYIQQSLCPSGDDYIWQSIGQHGLFIHLFTNNLRNSQYAQCLRA
ncbi:hypothetical protein NI389_19755 (plasmid) [Pseudoalteromonas xiamenensis]|uniref:hypothetical protein n=1 Tax=Pseudoalteromonas xiamenensis TaxID=882626 RepID=UPI0027E562B5|nr:hypothetical protein [Pseudoalteromonas xiamenensis]WMN62037.1 hypothetical protein NI389_19755 [Pseudoalteromonas xiamenensis]